MKKFTFKGVLDGFRSSVQQQSTRPEQDFQENLRPDHFTLKRTFRHGFPYCPTAFDFDPVQRLLAIGDKSGFVQILGRPGVDKYIRHEGESSFAVTHIQFLVNEGAFVTVTADDTLHLWNIRTKTPTVVQSLKFQRERVTCLHLPVGSKWIYVGTEKGNVHVVHIATFALSGYIINWNKAMEVVRTSHPGAVISLCDNPIDSNKLLIAYECGLLVLWDLRGKFAEIRWQASEPAKSVAWHYEGKYFVSSHVDGSLCSWPAKYVPKPQTCMFPHGKADSEGAIEKCKPIFKVDIKTNQLGETFTIFSGGLPADKGSKMNCITVMLGKSTTVLEMEHNVVDFITMCENPWSCETQEPFAIAVLLQNDLVVIDLLSPGFPCFETPYPMDLHESPVTCCTYLTDCPSDLVPAFYSVGRSTTGKKSGFSEREWPISGGDWCPSSCSYSEIVITGHQDGSLKFWDSGAGTLQILYKLKTSKVFEKTKSSSVDSMLDSPLAIQIVSICPESRRMCISGAFGHVMLFKFRKVETSNEILVLEIPILYEHFDDFYGISPESDLVLQQASETTESDKMDSGLKVKLGPHRKPPGFQPQLVCMTTGPNRRNVQITSLCINSCYGIMAYGSEYGLVVIDIIQKVCLLSIACPDLYGAQDPYYRIPKSPKRYDNRDEQSRSPSSDQLYDNASPEKNPVDLVPENCDTQSTQPCSPVIEQTESNREPKSNVLPTDDTTSLKENQDRRKSVSWKTFNLKRQLSKVNMKIGLTVEAENGSTKQSSVCCSEESEKDSSPEEVVSSLSNDELDLSSKKNISDESSDKVEALRFEEVNQNYILRKKSNNIPMAQKQKCPQKDQQLPDVSTETISNIQNTITQEKVENTVLRPTNLPLFVSGTEAVTAPEKPLRQKIKDNRDQRLLSVPNIKYQMREMRVRSSKSDSSPSCSGNMQKQMSSPGERRVHSANETINCVCSENDGASSGINLSAASNEQISSDSASSDTTVRNACPSSSNVGTFSQQPVLAQQSTQAIQHQSMSSESLRKSKSQDKIDGSFSRSRSSSMSSIDMASSESVTCLALIESLSRRNDTSIFIPTLWIGTSFGSILTLFITMPDKDVRKSQPVLITINGGPTFRLKGSITSLAFLNGMGYVIPFPYELWKDDSREGRKDRTPSKSGSRSSPTFLPNTADTNVNPTVGASSGNLGSVSSALDSIADKQYVVVVTEKQTRVFDVINQYCINKMHLSESDFVVKSEIVSMKDGSCLATFLSNGHIMVYSLPSLKLLLINDFLPLMELSFQTKCKQGIVDPMLSIWGQQLIVNEDTNQISKIFCFSNKGHGLYLASPTEIQKFSISAEFCQFLPEMMAELFTPHVMPDQPKESFLKGLFRGGAKNLDREELFGEQSGKANRSVAKHIPGSSVDQLGQRASTAASEISRAHQLAMERGEKLNLLEERAERMANQAQDFSGTAHQLMLKYKDKKWYQL